MIRASGPQAGPGPQEGSRRELGHQALRFAKQERDTFEGVALVEPDPLDGAADDRAAVRARHEVGLPSHDDVPEQGRKGLRERHLSAHRLDVDRSREEPTELAGPGARRQHELAGRNAMRPDLGLDQAVARAADLGQGSVDQNRRSSSSGTRHERFDVARVVDLARFGAVESARDVRAQRRLALEHLPRIELDRVLEGRGLDGLPGFLARMIVSVEPDREDAAAPQADVDPGLLEEPRCPLLMQIVSAPEQRSERRLGVAMCRKQHPGGGPGGLATRSLPVGEHTASSGGSQHVREGGTHCAGADDQDVGLESHGGPFDSPSAERVRRAPGEPDTITSWGPSFTFPVERLSQCE